MKNRIFAWINLAWRFAVHVLVRMPKRVFTRGSDYRRFTETVEPEGYRPLTTEERARFPHTMNCVHCGLCSIVCPELRAAPADAWAEAWTFVAGASRSIDRAEVVTADAGACADCSACASVCPTGVPIPQMAAMVRRLAAGSHAGGVA